MAFEHCSLSLASANLIFPFRGLTKKNITLGLLKQQEFWNGKLRAKKKTYGKWTTFFSTFGLQLFQKTKL